MPRNTAVFFAFPGLFAFALGCAGPGAQVKQLQTEKDELISTVKAQKDAQESLQQRAASLEKRLDQSEKEIARLTGHKSTWDDEPRTATTKGSAKLPLPLKEGPGEGTSPSKPEEKLPWRAPSTKSTDAGQAPPAATSKKSQAEPDLNAPASTKISPTLRSLAQRDSRLQYDPSTDTARYQLDIGFEDGGAGLTAEGRKRLDDLASWLKAEQTRDLRVLVSGSSTGMRKPKSGEEKPRYANDRQLGAARAGAVADYLDRHGITPDRLVIVGSGGPSHALEDTSGSPVQIHLAPSTAPILGLVPKQPSLRR